MRMQPILLPDWPTTLNTLSSTTSPHSIMPSADAEMDKKYVVDEDAALVILEEMYAKICCEDQTLRTFRRSLSFGHYIKCTLIPLLMSTKREPIIELTMRLLANLTMPVECLYAVDILARTEAGRKNIAEIRAMLTVTKRSVASLQAMRALVDYMRGILEKDTRISPDNCVNINNCLIVLRNVLHIPDNDRKSHLLSPTAHGDARNRKQQSSPSAAAAAADGSDGSETSVTAGDSAVTQNQIMYNLFALSIDKMLIHLMSCPQREYFVVAMVQLIALMYKDQHISTLQSRLITWFDASMSDSSEDFESNTTPMKAASGNSSPILTSDSSSDHGGNNTMKTTGDGQQQQQQMNGNVDLESHTSTSINSDTKRTNKPSMKREDSGVIDFIDPGSRKSSVSSNNNSSSGIGTQDSRKRSIFSEMSDCGYGTQVESSGRPEIILTTSSNEDDLPQQIHQHQKPPATNQKQRYNAVNNPRSAIARNDKREWRRKKLVKRSKTSFINMNGALHYGPSDTTIANILKEFTIDFLLKCYGLLVKGLHGQLLTQPEPASDIDTSHFFWLITYFLKLNAQIELDLEHVKQVLSLGIISFLTYAGVGLSEELMLLLNQEGVDTRSCVRRLHLVVTAIKEFLQTLNCFKRIALLRVDDKEHLHQLTLQISDLSGLQCLFVMLLRNYNAKIHSKQYLQDIIVTNHVLLILLDEASKYTDYRGSVKMNEHIEQFATIEIMQQYGLLLTDYQDNGEFVNDCIFTMMHHIGGDIGQVSLLFQPNILKTFSKIFETEYDLCDDWSDLIEYIIHKFLNTPQQRALSMPRFSLTSPVTGCTPAGANAVGSEQKCILSNVWTSEETDLLFWYYEQSRQSDDLIGAIIQLFASNDQRIKSRIAVVEQLLLQDLIPLAVYDDYMAVENASTAKSPSPTAGRPGMANGNKSPMSASTDELGVSVPNKDSGSASVEGDHDDDNDDEIQVLKQRIISDNKGNSLRWVQKTLIDCCYVKLTLKRQLLNGWSVADESRGAMEPIPLHYSMKLQAIPVVPWNSDQSVVHLYPPFMLLLHKLGFHLPAESGNAFVRIPAFWTADILFNVAQKLGPVSQSMLRFDLSELLDTYPVNIVQAKQNLCGKNTTYGMYRRRSMVRFTPVPLTQYASHWLDMYSAQQVQVGTVANTTTPLDRATPCSPENDCELGTSVALAATGTTATLTGSAISSDISADDAPTMHASDFESSSGCGGSLCFAFRLPVLHESIDEEEDDDDDDEDDVDSNDNKDDSSDGNVHGAMLMQFRLEASVANSKTPSGLSLNACETASVVSDSTHVYDLYVSDGEDA